MKSRVLAGLVAVGLALTLAGVGTAYAEWYETEEEWVEVGTTGNSYVNEQGQQCVEKWYQLHTVTYQIDESGNRQWVNDLAHNRYMTAWECTDQGAQGWTSWDEYWETGNYQYLGHSGLDSSGRCYSESWNVEIGVQTHWYLDGSYWGSDPSYTYWEQRWYGPYCD